MVAKSLVLTPLMAAILFFQTNICSLPVALARALSAKVVMTFWFYIVDISQTGLVREI